MGQTYYSFGPQLGEGLAKAIEGTRQRWQHRKWSESADEGMAAAQGSAEEMAMERQKEIEEKRAYADGKLDEGVFSREEHFTYLADHEGRIEAKWGTKFMDHWSKVNRAAGSNPLFSKKAQEGHQQQMLSLEQRRNTMVDRYTAMGQQMVVERQQKGETTRQNIRSGKNPHSEGTEMYNRWESDEDYRRNTEAAQIAAGFQKVTGDEFSQLMAVSGISGEAAGNFAEGLSGFNMPQWIEQTELVRITLEEGGEKARERLKQFIAKDAAPEGAAAENAPGGAPAEGAAQGGEAQGDPRAGLHGQQQVDHRGGPSTKAQPTKEAATRAQKFFKDFFLGEAQRKARGETIGE